MNRQLKKTFFIAFQEHLNHLSLLVSPLLVHLATPSPPEQFPSQWQPQFHPV